jgi:septal ring factor EnvC (AmiA/AmiB activator)
MFRRELIILRLKGSVRRTALVISSVANIVLCGALIHNAHTLKDTQYELNKARTHIIQQNKSLNHQLKVIKDLSIKNDKLLKDNASLNQQLKSTTDQVTQLQQKLAQTESELEQEKK